MPVLRNMIYFIALLMIGAITNPGYSQATASDKIIEKADSLYSNFEEKAALEQYKAYLKDHPEHYRSLWRTGYLYSRIGKRLDNEQEQNEYYDSAVEYAERALEADSSRVESNFVMAVAMGRQAMIAGARERVAASRKIKHYADRAKAIDPDHAGTLHLLGRWHAKITNLNFAERMAAKYLFGGVPEASVDKALEYMEQAVERKPKAILYRYDLAKLYLRLDEEEKATSMLKGTVSLKSRIPRDDKLLRKSRELLEDIG